MGTTAYEPQRDTGGGAVMLALLAASAIAHVVTFIVLPSTAPDRGPKNTVVEMAFYEPPPPPPPARPSTTWVTPPWSTSRRSGCGATAGTCCAK